MIIDVFPPALDLAIVSALSKCAPIECFPSTVARGDCVVGLLHTSRHDSIVTLPSAEIVEGVPDRFKLLALANVGSGWKNRLLPPSVDGAAETVDEWIATLEPHLAPLEFVAAVVSAS